jgi:hypothetical protein
LTRPWKWREGAAGDKIRRLWKFELSNVDARVRAGDPDAGHGPDKGGQVSIDLERTSPAVKSALTSLLEAPVAPAASQTPRKRNANA